MHERCACTEYAKGQGTYRRATPSALHRKNAEKGGTVHGKRKCAAVVHIKRRARGDDLYARAREPLLLLPQT
jgi:hypothetical protein